MEIKDLTEVSKMIKTSHASFVLMDPFLNPDTNLVATDLASSSQVLMISVTKPLKNVLVSTHNKYYGIQATNQPTTSTKNPSLESIPPTIIPELTIKPLKGVIHKSTFIPQA